MCSVCVKIFDSKEKRKAHVQEHHPTKKVQFNCPECGKKLCSRGSVQLHVQAVHKKHKPFLCQVNKIFILSLYYRALVNITA